MVNKITHLFCCRLQDPGSAQAELAAIQALENTTKKYENLYNEIIMLCGKNSMSIDEICEEYRSREDENFAIFSYINEVNHEVRWDYPEFQILLPSSILS